MSAAEINNYPKSPPIKETSSEIEHLRNSLQKEVSLTEVLQSSLNSLQLQNSNLIQEMEDLKLGKLDILASSQSSGDQKVELLVKIEELEAEVENKTSMLIDVKKHLSLVAEREKKGMPPDTLVRRNIEKYVVMS